MDVIVGLLFKFIMYTFIGLSLEIIFAVLGISRALGFQVEGRVPKKYREGFVSLYMIPVHGFGLLVFEEVFHFISDWFFLWRYIIWCILFTLVEALVGFIYDKFMGFYSWDYYADSKFKVFKRGYTLWTLLPLWGIAGLFLESFVKIVSYVSPHVMEIVLNRF